MNDVSWGNLISGRMPEAADTLLDVLINSDLGPQPAAHGVVLFREYEGGLDNPSGNAAFYADVTFGAGAASTNFLCDWRGQFSVVCQRIGIRARSFAPRTPPYDRGTASESYRHGAFLGFGGWHSGKPLSFTDYERVYDPTDDPSWVQVVAVPKFARRFFPRLSVLVGGVESGNAAQPAVPADVETIQLGITRGGQPQAKFSQCQFVSPEVLRDGLDVSDAAFVTLTFPQSAPGLPLIPRKYYYTPVFELAL